MGEITEEHREYALVDRMSDLLRNPPKTEFEETFCYAVFSSIVPWVCQRVRSENYHDIYRKLEETELPDEISKYFRMNKGEDLPNAGQALVDIRNAISHADCRRVFPINVNGFLRGFKWQLCRKKNNSEKEIGILSMRTVGIKKVGIFYADYFCRELRSLRNQEKDQQFYHAVNDSLKEVA